MIDRQTVDSLLEQAYTLIQKGDAEQAIAVGNELLRHKHARGFEIIALAYEQQGRSEEAIRILQEGVAKVPKAWPLWELLGNVYSDQESFQEAQNCYTKALSCPNVDGDSVQYNVAILLKRQSKFGEALSLCERIKSADVAIKVQVLRLAILNSMQRYDDVLSSGTNLIQGMLTAGELPEEDTPDLSRAFAEMGRAFWEARQDRQRAWENAWKALEWDRSNSSALWLVREIINRKSARSRWWKLVIEGQWHFPLEANRPAPRFISTYEVVADTVEEAITFARDLEPVEVRQSMRVDSQEDLGSFPDNQQGVYWRSAYGFYN